MRSVRFLGVLRLSVGVHDSFRVAGILGNYIVLRLSSPLGSPVALSRPLPKRSCLSSVGLCVVLLSLRSALFAVRSIFFAAPRGPVRSSVLLSRARPRRSSLVLLTSAKPLPLSRPLPSAVIFSFSSASLAGHFSHNLASASLGNSRMLLLSRRSGSENSGKYSPLRIPGYANFDESHTEQYTLLTAPLFVVPKNVSDGESTSVGGSSVGPTSRVNVCLSVE